MADGNEYPAYATVRTLWRHFFPYRGFTPSASQPYASKMDTKAGASAKSALADLTPEPTRDTVVDELSHFGYLRLNATRTTPRGKRDRVVVFVLDGEGEYSRHSSPLRKLVSGVFADKEMKEALDAIILVYDADVVKKKFIGAIVDEFNDGAPAGPDPDGLAPACVAYPFHLFPPDPVPTADCVGRHRIMSEEEVTALLARERLSLRDLYGIYETDPPAAWLGARAGQVVEITGDSETAGIAITYRLVKKG